MVFRSSWPDSFRPSTSCFMADAARKTWMPATSAGMTAVRAHLSGVRRPELSKLRRHHLLVRHVAVQEAEIAGEGVHAGHEIAGNGGVVEGQVAANQLGDQCCLFGRKELFAD